MNQLELRDIHLPDAIFWWPPAPGWWIVVALMVLLMVALPWLVKRLKYKSLNRQCLDELALIHQSIAAGQTESAVLGEIAALLRRAVISRQGRAGFAASTGDDWLAQLQNQASDQTFSDAELELLSHNRYCRDFECDVEKLMQACENWIRSLPRDNSHVSD